MSNDRDRLEKVIAVALNPGAYEEEAFTALRKARELVRQDPQLAHAPPPPTPAPEPPPPVEHSLAFPGDKDTAVLDQHLHKQRFGGSLRPGA
jgi:hypothetical protein